MVLEIRIYLDETVDNDILRMALKKANFDIISAKRIGMTNKMREEHIQYATANRAVLLTNDPMFAKRTFKVINKGILIIYSSTNLKNVMSLPKIVSALKNVRDQMERNNFDLTNKVFPLNVFLP
ncbi:MAG TPA: DUF5615 family PIN-like protein [Candidatus Nanoarchaeia archaeon]|nr:DUF5615 family PIN-like protein [Candidatus Nanoarchaeia archaeon]